MNSAFFGICLTIFTFEIGKMINKKYKTPLLNPLLICIILCIAFLKLTNISYESYSKGGNLITFLIAPATVAIVINLYKNLNLLLKNSISILIGTLVGSLTSIMSVMALSKLFNLNIKVILSVLPKSITTAVGAPLAQKLNGDFTIAVICIVITGITGSIIAPLVIKLLKSKNKVAIGVGIGTSSHTVGTSKAIEIGEVEGAISGLAMVISAFITVIVLPLIVSLI